MKTETECKTPSIRPVNSATKKAPPLAGSAGPVVTPLCRSCLFNDDMSASSSSIRPQHPVCLPAKARKLSSHSLPRDDLAQHLTRPDLMSHFLC